MAKTTLVAKYTAAPSQVLSTTSCFISELHFDNLKGSTVIIQIHDATALPSNGATPVLEWEVAAGASLSHDFQFPLHFENGVVAASSTTQGTLTIAVTNDIVGTAIKYTVH